MNKEVNGYARWTKKLNLKEFKPIKLSARKIVNQPFINYFFF